MFIIILTYLLVKVWLNKKKEEEKRSKKRKEKEKKKEREMLKILLHCINSSDLKG
jgi:large-conductance mechanosensitive channel